MKLKNVESLASMDLKHLQAELDKAHTELSEVKLRQRMNQLKDVNETGKLKKRIAIIQTYVTKARNTK